LRGNEDYCHACRIFTLETVPALYAPAHEAAGFVVCEI
jgi:hypothetical protein